MDAQAWDERYAEKQFVWSEGPNRFVEESLADLDPGRALDLAAGEGRNARWLASLGWEVTAMDFSSVAIEKGRARSGDLPITWVVGDALTDELPTCDLALLAYLQLPAEERAVAVRRAFECLDVGGHFFLVAHDSTNLDEGTGGPQDPAVLYTAEDVLADLHITDDEQHGVEVIRAERVARPVTADDEHAHTRHTDDEAPDPAGTGPVQHDGEPIRAWDALVHLVRVNR